MKIPQSLCSLAAVAAFSTLTLPHAAAADTLPTYATHNRGGETIHGTIASLSSNGDIYVRDDRGYVDHVSLHQGTVIEPTGFELGAGDVVTIIGQNGGSVLHADEIDAVPSDGSSANYAPADYGDQVYGGGDYGGYYPGGYYPYGYDYGVGVYFGGGYGGYGGYHGYHGRGGGYNGHGGYGGGYGGGGSYGRGGASYGRGASGGGGSRGVSGGGSHGGMSGGGAHGGGGHR